MNIPDLSILIDCDQEYNRLYSVLEDKYNCEWDDKVHDSFARYKSMINRYSDRINMTRQNAENIKRKIEAIESKNIIERYKDLCAEAESV